MWLSAVFVCISWVNSRMKFQRVGYRLDNLTYVLPMVNEVCWKHLLSIAALSTKSIPAQVLSWMHLWRKHIGMSSGSSGRVRGGGSEKHEIYVGTFGGHLFYDLFSQGWGAWPPWLPLDPLLGIIWNLTCILVAPVSNLSNREIHYFLQSFATATYFNIILPILLGLLNKILTMRHSVWVLASGILTPPLEAVLSLLLVMGAHAAKFNDWLTSSVVTCSGKYEHVGDT